MNLSQKNKTGLHGHGAAGGVKKRPGGGTLGRRARRKRGEPAASGVTHDVKRGAFERMKWIYGHLQDEKYPNCTTIAGEFRVSVKTAARDVDFMRDRWTLPIGYDDKQHGFYFTEKVQRLPWVPVSEAELFAVCVTQKVLETYQGMPFQRVLELAFAKMTRSLDEDERYMLENLDTAFSFRPFAPEDPDLKVLELVTRAVAERRGLRFTYRKPGEKRSETREVHPYHVFNYEGRMYLRAHDPARGARRTFLLARMTVPVMTATRFDRPKDFNPKEEFSTSLGVMKGDGDYQVVIEMDAWLTDVLRGRRFHHSQVVDEIPGGGSHLRMRLSALEEIEQYVLSWGTHATVIGPAELRSRVGKTVRQLAERYANVVPSTRCD